MFILRTGDLFAMRRGIIWWVTAMCAPWEFVFDVIEDELENRGHHMRPSGESLENTYDLDPDSAVP